MSRLITNTDQLESIPTIKNTIRKISFNPHSFRTSSLPFLNPQAQMTQQLFLNNICKKISDGQRQNIRIKAFEEAQEQIHRIKGKLRRNVRKENISIIMGDKKTTYKNALNSIMRVPTEQIEIDKKHHRKINMKLSMLNEAKAIGKCKASYNQWYDSSKNSPTHSPIYSRINFLLEKVSKQDPNLKLSKVTRKSLEGIYTRSNNVSYYKLNRKKTEGYQVIQSCK